MTVSTTITPTRRRRQPRRRQRQPEFYAGQTLEISKFPWPTPQTRIVEIEDIREVSYTHISASIPNGVWFHLRDLDNGSLSIVGYSELRRRVVEVL